MDISYDKDFGLITVSIDHASVEYQVEDEEDMKKMAFSLIEVAKELVDNKEFSKTLSAAVYDIKYDKS